MEKTVNDYLKNAPILKHTLPDEQFAVGFLTSQSDLIDRRIADGMLNVAENLPLSINPDYRLAGIMRTDKGIQSTETAVVFNYGNGFMIDTDLLEKKAKQHPDLAEDYIAIRDFFYEIRPATRIFADYSPEEKFLFESNTLWGGGEWGGHCNINFALMPELGTDGLRAKIEKYRPLHPDRSEWYDACLTVLLALDTIADRFRRLALQMETTAPDADKPIFRRIAKALETVPKKPAVDFTTAVQSFYLLYTFDGVDSPGSFDQYMWKYYRISDKAEAREILEGLWRGFHDNRAWNLCIGGSNPDGSDRSNALTAEILDVCYHMGFQTPNLTFRWHKNMPDSLLRAAAKCLSTGIGIPALYNDESVIPALVKHGIPKEDAHLYVMNGCNQIDIMGKSHMGLEDGELFLLKALEYALFDGVDLLTGKQASIKTGDASTYSSFDDVMNAYRKQVEYLSEKITVLSNRSQAKFAEFAPNPLRSMFLEGCIESGVDYRSGGAIYNHGQVLAEGMSDTSDSLLALKRAVFEDKIVTMPDLLSALKNDFAGEEVLRKKLASYPKFGNDNVEADEMGREIQTHFFQTLRKFKTWRGHGKGYYGGGFSSFNRMAKYGSSAGASANGRHSMDPLISDSIGAVPGCDKKGPTAALKSALRYDHSLAISGFVMQLKFEKSLFSTEEGINRFLILVKTYFLGGGQQLSVNVLDRDELLAAKNCPERHGGLIVRVGGYSDYFTRLTPELQDNIIARSTF